MGRRHSSSSNPENESAPLNAALYRPDFGVFLQLKTEH